MLTTHCWFTVEGMEGGGEEIAASRREGHSGEAERRRLDRGGVCNAAVVGLPPGAWRERERAYLLDLGGTLSRMAVAHSRSRVTILNFGAVAPDTAEDTCTCQWTPCRMPGGRAGGKVEGTHFDGRWYMPAIFAGEGRALCRQRDGDALVFFTLPNCLVIFHL